MIVPIYAIFVERIGGSILEASGAWAVFALTAGILMYLIGRWEDRHKHHLKMLFFGYLITAFAFLGYIFISSPAELLVLQIIAGIGSAIIFPSYDALYSGYLDKGRPASEWGMLEGMERIVAAISALIGGIIASYLGFNVLFFAMFSMGIISAVAASTLLFDKSGKRKNRQKRKTRH